MIGELIARLIAAGTPLELAAEVVADAFAAGMERNVRGIPVDISAEKRRAYDRERKRKLRGNPQMSAEIRGIPETDSIEDKKERRKERKLDRRASQIPPDWRPDPEPWKISVGKLGAARCETELIRFKNHAADKGRVSKNWNAAWRNWCDRALDYGAKLNGQAADNPKAGSLIGAIDRRLAEIEGESDSALPEDNLFRLSNRPV